MQLTQAGFCLHHDWLDFSFLKLHLVSSLLRSFDDTFSLKKQQYRLLTEYLLGSPALVTTITSASSAFLAV